MRHGTEYAYRKKSCRCATCRAYKSAANSTYQRENAAQLIERDRIRNRDQADERRVGRRVSSAKRRGVVIVDFTADELVQRLSMFPGCWVCGGTPTEVDHVKPLAAGGLHGLANMRPICGPCNRRKSAKWPFVA